MMAIDELLLTLDSKDTAASYRALLELERLSEETDALYGYTKRFADMCASAAYIRRVRGFRLFCKQARWDKDNRIAESLPLALRLLHDEKPTAVRQALAALVEIVRYKPQLRGAIASVVDKMDPAQYKDSMQGLILKDIRALTEAIRAQDVRK